MRQTINKWGKFIEAQIPEAQLPRLEFNCTMTYDLESNTNKENKWQKETEGQNMK